MAFEFHIHINCPIQENYSPDEFRRMAKLKAMAEMVTQNREAIEQPDRAFEDTPVQLAFEITDEDGNKTNEVTVGQLLATWQNISEQATPICSGCPVNLRQSPLGCYAAITYPITAAGEKWFLDQFDPPDGEFGYVPSHLKSGGITGESMDLQRCDPETEKRGLLESPHPFTKKLPNVHTEGETEYSSSSLLEYLFACQPALIPESLLGLCRDFGAVEIGQLENVLLNTLDMFGEKDEKLKESPAQKMKDSLFEEVRFRHAIGEGDDRSVLRMKLFLYACWVAYCHEGIVAIDG